MFETAGTYKNITVKMYVDKIDHFPWFVNLPTSFSVSKYTIFYEIYKGNELITKIASPIAIKVHWFEEPEFKKIERNLPIELKYILQDKFEKDEIDFAIKTIMSFGMGIQSIDSVKKGNITKVYYAVKDGDSFRVFTLGKQVALVKFVCQNDCCDVLFNDEKIDTVCFGEKITSNYPQIESFIESYISTMWGDFDDAFFEFLAKKYVGIIGKKK